MSNKNWTQPCCEACWIENNQTEADGETRIRMPVTAGIDPRIGIKMCCYCGKPTIVGIFVRVDPDTVLFPEQSTN